MQLPGTNTTLDARALLAAMALLALVLLPVHHARPAGAAGDRIAWHIEQQPYSGALEHVQVGAEIGFTLVIRGPLPDDAGESLSFTMKKPANMSFAGADPEEELVCHDDAPAAGFLRCTFDTPELAAGAEARFGPLRFRIEPAAAGAQYERDALIALFDTAPAGLRDEPGTRHPLEHDESTLGLLQVLNTLGPGANVSVTTVANPAAVVEGGLTQVAITFEHALAPIGPLLAPLEAKVLNGDIQRDTIVCPGGGSPSTISNSAICTGGTIATGGTMTFDVRARDTGDGADVLVRVAAPSLGLTFDKATTAAEGQARRTVPVDEVGLETVGAGPPWAIGEEITVCTGLVLEDVANDHAAGAPQSPMALGTSTWPPSVPFAKTDFLLIGPDQQALDFTYLGSGECGPAQSGLRFTPTVAGSYEVRALYNGDDTSAATLAATRGMNTLALTVAATNPAPTITALSPNRVQQGGDAFLLAVEGSDFVAGSIVRWNGVDQTTFHESATRIYALISAEALADAGTADITVSNPAPGGGTSNSQPLTVEPPLNPAPAISALQPASAEAGAPGFTLLIEGANFVDSSVVRWNGEELATTFLSSTQVRAVVPAAKLAAAGSAVVTVFTPAPGGGPSVPKLFTITAGSGSGDGDDDTDTTPGDGIQVLAPEGLVARSRLTFTASEAGLGLESVSFVVRRVADGAYWNSAAGRWQDEEFENEAVKSGGRWEHAITGAARRQFVNTTVEVEVRGTKDDMRYTGAETVELRIR